MALLNLDLLKSIYSPSPAWEGSRAMALLRQMPVAQVPMQRAPAKRASCQDPPMADMTAQTPKSHGQTFQQVSE